MKQTSYWNPRLNYRQKCKERQERIRNEEENRLRQVKMVKEVSKPVWKDYFMKLLSGSINAEKTQKEDTETQKTQRKYS